MTTAEPTGCYHERVYGTCDEFACRAKSWSGPEGLTAGDLRYSVVVTIERPFRIGRPWPRPDALPGVSWKFCRRESCGTEDGFVAHVYSAAMDLEAFTSLVEGFEQDGESGGLIGPIGAEKWWAPSAVYVSDYNERLTATAWPKQRVAVMGMDEHLYDEWDDICELLIGEPAWTSGETLTPNLTQKRVVQLHQCDDYGTIKYRNPHPPGEDDEPANPPAAVRDAAAHDQVRGERHEAPGRRDGGPPAPHG